MHRAQNHANRFSPAAQIEYVIAGEGHLRIDVFDMAGEMTSRKMTMLR